MKKNKLDNFYSFLENKSTLLLISLTIIVLLEYFILGKFSVLQMHDFADDVFPRYISLWENFFENGFSYWDPSIGTGHDRLSNLVYYDNFMSMLISNLPNWLAFQIFVVLSTSLGIYGFYKYMTIKFDAEKSMVLIPAILIPIITASLNSTGFVAGLQFMPFMLYALFLVERLNLNNFFKLILIVSLFYIFSLVISFTLGFVYSIPFVIVWFMMIDRKPFKFIIILLIGILFVSLIHHQNFISLLENSSSSQRQIFQGLSYEGTSYFLIQVPLLIVLSLILLYEKIKDKYIFLLLTIFLLITIGDRITTPLWFYLFENTPLESLKINRIAFFSPIILGLCLSSITIKRISTKSIYIISLFIYFMFLMGNEKYDNLKSWIIRGNYVANFETEVLENLKNEDESLYRVSLVHGATHPNMLAAYGFETAGGYSPMYPVSYKKYWGNVIKPLKSTNIDYYNYFDGWGSRFYLYTGGHYEILEPKDFFDINLLSLINVKYLISHQPLNDKRLRVIHTGINAMKMNNYDKARLRFKENFNGRESLFIYQNEEYLQRFFTVQNVIFYNNNNELNNLLVNPELGFLKNNLLLNNRYKYLSPKGKNELSFSEIKVLKYLPDQIEVKVNVNSESFLIVSNNYNNRWSCTINDESKPIMKAYGSFWAIELNKGINNVRFYYKSRDISP